MQFSQEEAHDKAIAYYPEGVGLQYIGEDKITDETNQDGFVAQYCHLFDVVYGEKLVSGVAVGTEDGSVWFRDMNSGRLWLSEGFMGYPRENPDNDVVREPIIDVSNNETAGIAILYFAHINTITELSGQNEGSAIWHEATQTLSIQATKITGTVTGAPDGPSFMLDVTWVGGKPEIENIGFRPAPMYSHPELVLFSDEELAIESDRLIEIAEYFKGIIDEELSSIQ